MRKRSAIPPANSRVRTILARSRDICARYSESHDAWLMIMREFGDRDASKASTNLALTFLSLFHGRGDFKRTVQLCIWAGWDTDCTAATAGALLGVLNGASTLPADWLNRLGPTLVCGIEVKHKHVPLTELTEATCRIGLEMAAVRNKTVTLTGAPKVTVRKAPAPGPRIEAIYPDEPVLYSQKTTPVTLAFHNPTHSPVSAPLTWKLPESCAAAGPLPDRCKVEAGSSSRIEIQIRHAGGNFIPDKNLMQVAWGEAGKTPLAAREFGLGGARQWRVYGPYWDMWDISRNAECPYNNATRQSNPFIAECGGDSYNQYVRLDHQYLDEARLCREDLPAELPFTVEAGEDLITNDRFGGFLGQACYYLVRTVQSRDYSGPAQLSIARSGPYRIWFDGREIHADPRPRAWGGYETDGATQINLTGKPQRLVIKVLRISDEPVRVQPIFVRANFMGGVRGISYLCDCLEDMVVGQSGK